MISIVSQESNEAIVETYTHMHKHQTVEFVTEKVSQAALVTEDPALEGQ